MPNKVAKDIHEAVIQSYERCLAQPGFFDEFYDRFINSSPEVKPLFRHTDFKRQHALLKVGLYYLIHFADDEGVKADVKALGVMHSRSMNNIRPELYPFWVYSLMQTVNKFDIHFNDELEQSWRRVLQKGIDLMISLY